MITSHRDTKGLGNTALYARIRDGIGRYWNLSTLAWVDAESEDTKNYLREYPDSDPLESRYATTIALPEEQCIVEHVRASDGAVRATEDTVPYGQLSAVGSVPIAPAAELCTLYEYLRHQNGTPASGARVKLKIVSLPYDYVGALFSGAEVEAVAGADGSISWTAPRGCTVLVASASMEFGIKGRAATVPDSGSASLSANWVPDMTPTQIAALTPTVGQVVFNVGAAARGALQVWRGTPRGWETIRV